MGNKVWFTLNVRNVAGVYLFLQKETKMLLRAEETAISYVLIVVKCWLKVAESGMDGNEHLLLDRLNPLFYSPHKPKREGCVGFIKE